MQPSKTHLRALDQIRGIAILAVFAYHCLATAFGHESLTWGTWFRHASTSPWFLVLLPLCYGWAGVAVFFVVSGFCIHLSYRRGTPGAWGTFFSRRFFRIYPPYLVALLAFGVVLPLTRLSFRHWADWEQMGTHLLLIHNWDERTYHGINGSFWSIAVECQLYAIYPALLALVGRIGWRRTLMVLGAIEVALRGFAGGYHLVLSREIPLWFTGLPLYYWFSWSIGAALADAYIERRALPFASWPASAILLLAAATFWIKPLHPLSFPAFALLTATLLARLLATDGKIRLPKPLLSHLETTGICSYSLYLLHQPIILLASLMLGSLTSRPILTFASCLAAYPLVLGVSWLFYRHCELSAIALGKLAMRPRVPKPSAALGV